MDNVLEISHKSFIARWAFASPVNLVSLIIGNGWDLYYRSSSTRCALFWLMVLNLIANVIVAAAFIVGSPIIAVIIWVHVVKDSQWFNNWLVNCTERRWAREKARRERYREAQATKRPNEQSTVQTIIGALKDIKKRFCPIVRINFD